MTEFLDSMARLGSLLQRVVFGKDFDSSFPYAVAFVAIAIVIGVILRRTDPVRLRAKLKNVSATSLLYFINLFAFAPFVLVADNTIRTGYEALGLPQLDPAIWSGVSPWLLVPVALIAYDFADYWSHRVMHQSWLWPVHAIHHSETEMTGLTTYRVHFLEPIIMGTAYILLLTWLGLSENILGYGAILVSLHNVYVHMDLDWGHGPFRLFLASPRYHRWHHANVPEAYGKNLANIFPFWDVLFGTYYMPGTCKKPLGVDGMAEYDVVKLVLYPFRQWGGGLRRRFRRVSVDRDQTGDTLSPGSDSTQDAEWSSNAKARLRA